MVSELKKIPVISLEYKTGYPSPDTPVSYDNKGNVLSRFEDPSWDFSYYCVCSYTTSTIYFDQIFKHNNKDLLNKIIYEYKLIAYGFIYCNTNSQKYISTQIIITNHLSYIRKLLSISLECNSTLSNISENKILIKKLSNYLLTLESNKYNIIISLLKKISSLSIIFSNHNFSLTSKQFYDFNKIKFHLRKNSPKQHLVIPTEIYLRLILFIDNKLENFLKYSENIFNIFSKSSEIKNSYDFLNICKNHNLDFYCEENQIKSKRFLFLHFIHIITLALTKIIMFTGMRHGEALLLPFNCFEKMTLKNKSIYTITGYTTKLQFNTTKTTWITSSQVQTAIKVLKAITVNYLTSSGENNEEINYDNIPLSCFRPRVTRKNNKGLYSQPPIRNIKIKETLKHFNFNLILDSKAFTELEHTTPFHDLYEDYNVKIDHDFPITPHQFRRSLCVYSARSGFVNLPAIKEQLKHIKQDMTQYYANYAGDAPNIFDLNLCNDFNDQLILEQLSNFEDDIINSNNALYGGEGSRLQIAKESVSTPTFLSDIDETLKAFKDGKISYRRTPLGGCSRLSDCNEIEELSITACINCSDAIFNERTDKALQIALHNFQLQLKSLEPNSPFSIHLLAEINQVKRLLKKRKINIMEQDNNE